MSVKVQKQVSLPFAKAFEFAVKSIRARFWRSMITAGGVFLGIAFLASVLVSKFVAGPNAPLEEIARTNWLAGLSLLVCAVGITNSMFMSVTERFREIGTMKCLGALEQFVVKIFMIEAALTGFIASSLGWVVGTILMVVSKYLSFNPKLDTSKTWLGDLSWTNVGQSFIFCLILGVILTALATLFPALRASSIPPAAALRSDN